MKLITKMIPVMTIIVVTVLAIFLLDVHQSKNYQVFDSKNRDFIGIHYEEDVKVDNTVMEEILAMAKKNNVILQKTNYSTTESNVRNVYLSLETSKELYEFINRHLQLKDIAHDLSNEKAFISTYRHHDKNQMALIPDFLENNVFNYYRFDKLLSEQGNLYGEYVVYYRDYQDFTNFETEVRKLVGTDTKSYSYYNDLQSFVIITAAVSVFVLMLFYFIFQIYEIYDKSNHIGCMKLLGYSETRITNRMVIKRMKVYTLFVILLLFCCSVLLKNITLIDFRFLCLVNFFLIGITYCINYICVRIIFYGYDLSNLLKKQNIAVKISKTSIKLKMITGVLFIVLLSFFFQNLLPLYAQLKVYRNSKELLDYGVISSIHADAKEIYEYEKQSDLYELLVHDTRLQTFYAEFGSYGEMTEKEEEMTQELEEKGTLFQYGSVDRTYLRKEKITVYDRNNHVVALDKIDGIFFLFPKSQEDKVKAFQTFYETHSRSDYKKYQVDSAFRYYFYDNQKLNTYRLNLKVKYVTSPILRVVDESLRISYIESPLGINMFGTSFDTGLKISIVNNKKDTFHILEEDIKKAGLENLIGIDNFVSYSDYFESEVKLSQTVTLVAITVFCIVLFVYLMIAMQVISLYVKSERERVTVKCLLGFEREKIFSKIINQSILYNIIAFLISGIILIVMGSFHILFYLLSVLIFLIVDLIVLFTVIQFYPFTDIYFQLKGGNHD